MPNYMENIGSILAVLGGSLQWIRQYRSVSDWWIGLIAFGLAGGAYALCHLFTPDVRAEVIQALIWLPGGMAAVGGGTFAAALGAHVVGVIPATNSKG